MMDKTPPHPLFKLATELGPLLVFFIANAKFHLFVATGAFMVAVVAAMIASYVVTRHVPIMALGTVLSSAGGPQRNHLAHPDHRFLGELQGVRRDATDHDFCADADAADQA